MGKKDNSEPRPDKKGSLVKAMGWLVPKPIKKQHIEGYDLLKKVFTADKAACPSCNGGQLQAVVGGKKNQRKCDNIECQTIITLHELRDAKLRPDVYVPKVRAAYYNRQAGFIFLAAIILILSAMVVVIYTRSQLLFLSTLFLTVPVLSAAIAMRYRAWQTLENRLYEDTAPFRDFIKAQFRNVES
jgi:hypothetical protein